MNTNYFKNSLLGLFLIVASSMTIMAQGTISGIVVDGAGEPLLGANILIKATAEGTITDFDGTFSLTTEADFPLDLDISFTGYNGQTITLDGPTTDLRVEMVEGVLIGEDIIISASRRREKVQEAPASVSVLSARSLENSPNATDATRNLVNTAGVQIQQQSANRINISMRGSSGLFGTSVFPIMDYRGLVGPGIGTFQSDQAGIMNLDLERIEVVRGPGSALYGPGVTQGVVHFITKSPIDRPGTSAEVMYGELNTLGAAIRHATKVSEKFGFKVNVQHRRGDEFEYDPNNAEDAAYISTFLPNQGQGRGLYKPAVAGGTVDINSPGELLFSFDELDEDGNGNAMRQDWYNTSINTTLEFRPADQLSINVSGGFNEAASLFFNEQGPGLANATEYWAQTRVQAGGFFGQIFYVDNDGGQGDSPTFLYKTGNVTSIARDQLEAQLQYNFDTPNFLNGNWTAGFDYRSSGQDTENLTYGRNEDDDDFSIVGGYIQGKFGLSDKIDLVVAGRYDQFNFIDEGAFAPRAALVYKASPKHTFRASFNRANSTVSNLQLNIDFPLVSIIPNRFYGWLYGNKTPQTFGDNPNIEWFTPLIPGIPAGTPGAGLPLGALLEFPIDANGTTFNQALIAGVVAQLQSDPSTAAAAPIVQGVLSNLDPAAVGFGGALTPGFNIFDGSPLGLIDAPVSAIAVTDNIEVGYKGLIGDKLGVSWDVYWVREDKNSQFTAISPAYALTGIDGLAADLGNSVQAIAQPQIQAQLQAAFIAQGLDEATAAATATATATALGAGINGAYNAGGNQFLNTPQAGFGGASLSQVLTALPFHATVPTQELPNNGATNIGIGYRTFDARSYFGSDLGLEYFVDENLTLFGNYSWVSENEFMQSVIGSPEGSPLLPTNLNIPKNKFRIGARLTPEMGFRAQVAFQHDDSFAANAGDFSGIAQERNLVDASVGYKLASGLSLDLSATNLFDNEYRYYPNMPLIGRRVLGKITYSFE